ncbi:hypothetical protein RJ641_027643 [Dillenia turbinata]|uniref:Uncharacterized protein n=1 Tax=Dillenia turbinata TaxID=194707 RepID=A0AAN8W6G6_9MAGN
MSSSIIALATEKEHAIQLGYTPKTSSNSRRFWLGWVRPDPPISQLFCDVQTNLRMRKRRVSTKLN